MVDNKEILIRKITKLNHLSIRKIANKLGVSWDTVRKTIKQFGIEYQDKRKNSKQAAFAKKRYLKLLKMREQKLSYDEIANAEGISKQRIEQILKKFGKPNVAPVRQKKASLSLDDVEQIKKGEFNEKQFCRLHKISLDTLYTRIKELNLEYSTKTYRKFKRYRELEKILWGKPIKEIAMQIGMKANYVGILRTKVKKCREMGLLISDVDGLKT